MENYTVYKITNEINEKIYIGCHVTDNINDSYMGSGTNIIDAIKEFGRENFIKEILHNFDNKESMLEKEKELVNKEFIERENTYNIILGGGDLTTLGMVIVRDIDGKCILINKEDPRYLSGELKGATHGMVVVKDKNGECSMVKKTDERYLSGELLSQNNGTVCIKDENGERFKVSVDDPRYLSGEYTLYIFGGYDWNGKTHTEKTKSNIRISRKGKGKGDKNSQYGTCWVIKNGNSKKIKKEELKKFIFDGWIKGRKCDSINMGSKKGTGTGDKNSQYGTYWVTNGIDVKKIKKDELPDYISNGWLRGRTKKGDQI